ncbi:MULTISPECIES: signal peptidase I [unclassified Agarivorans]|uniref:signal peptidase I n=1 Tax=unclassified Agarivorans TaxID=2636026 RepID=UPI0010F429A0|nr:MULTISPECIES: signal peptidase I [unclassified Agarivorans]MDO6763141.1 signal peptidase I [Agarivorans sp. 1_MG-2023]GDY24434.1 signal peptidase I [Agarivorans sp. Toyoura001]
MATIFPLILVLATFVTGIIWALDKFHWEKQRAAKLLDARTAAGGELPSDAEEKITAPPGWIENGRSVFPVIAIVMVLRSFIYEPFQIPSGSMMPTLLVGDFILVEKFAYGLKDPVTRSTLLETGSPERGDVAVFKYPQDTRIDYIKRIVGLPGDRVIYRGKQLFIQPKCESTPCPELKPVPLDFEVSGRFKQGPMSLENYHEQLGEVSHEILINPAAPDRVQYFYQQPGTAKDEWIVPEGHYLAFGDNRDNSTDSRYWGFVSDENLVGKAVAIWISFEFERAEDSILPGWIPTGVRFNRIGAIK